jgi:hypothetical protein
MADIKVNKNAVEIRSELNANGIKVEYIFIDGKKVGIIGSVNAVDRAAAIAALNIAYTASNGNIHEMMNKLNTIATMEENKIEPDEVVKVKGRDIILSYSKAKAYTIDGTELANCEDITAEMPKEVVKALLMSRVEAALK